MNHKPKLKSPTNVGGLEEVIKMLIAKTLKTKTKSQNEKHDGKITA